MKIATIMAAATMLVAGSVQAEAKGCIKGAIIGGVAGHYLADRGVVGAVAGCLGGRYLANRAARRRDVDYGQRVRRPDGYAPRGGYGY
ncbi:hypothetical protein [Methylorubrum extorquens]|uniref:17 kDa surface antigen n=1 Tax=Methylorubrum extorquens (strain CM4 / NCIMB 13688) TaxID=440085 RepID=B7KYT8_METC4|nr:hypothetical protein [Methylorubrum extorquens]ACK81211.1 conserved hypothetical protein [Methylorubrum extorquens CM4]